MSNGTTNVMRPGMDARPRWCHVCGYERISEDDFVQPLRGYVADANGNRNPVYATLCVNCGSESMFPYNMPVAADLVIPPEWIGVVDDVVGVGAGMTVEADATVGP